MAFSVEVPVQNIGSAIRNIFDKVLHRTKIATKMAKIARQRFWGQAVWAIYCILTVFGLLALRNTDIVAYAIFGLFG